MLNADVRASLQRLGTNATGGTYPPIHVPLLDLGTGGELTRSSARRVIKVRSLYDRGVYLNL